MESPAKITRHSAFHWRIYTEIIIPAPKSFVWSILTDFEQMPKWSRALQSIKGNFSEGGKTEVEFFFQGRVRKLKHTIINFVEGQQFGWSDPLIPLSKDNHLYKLESLPDGNTKFIQTDEIKGFSTIFIAKMLINIMKESYPEFNRGLKQQVALALQKK